MVALVDRHNDGNLGGLGMRQRFQSLRHHTIVGRHDQNDDVGHIGTAGAHRREGGMTRSVEESEALQLAGIGMRVLDGVGTDVLGDATGFA